MSHESTCMPFHVTSAQASVPQQPQGRVDLIFHLLPRRLGAATEERPEMIACQRRSE